eukprot:snap_masked-scaffold_10-processed-gene-9.27-mRNA-1 protein AED:1.00 eAED:1.00 QI:0/0/0/0/1/1/5/0/131
MSFKAPSIQQQFENRNQRNKSYDDDYSLIEEERFGKEAEVFVKEVEMHEEITMLTCPLNFVGDSISFWFQKFSRVKVLEFAYCHLNTLNFVGMEKIKEKQNIQVLFFNDCTVPEDNSLSKFLRGQKLKSLK